MLKSKEQKDNYVSMQLYFNIPSVQISIKVFDGDKEIASGKGKGLVSIYAIRLRPSQHERESVSQLVSHLKDVFLYIACSTKAIVTA